MSDLNRCCANFHHDEDLLLDKETHDGRVNKSDARCVSAQDDDAELEIDRTRAS